MGDATAETERVPQEMILQLRLQRERVGRLKAEQHAMMLQQRMLEGELQHAIKEEQRIQNQMRGAYDLKPEDVINEDGTIARASNGQEAAATPAVFAKLGPWGSGSMG